MTDNTSITFDWDAEIEDDGRGGFITLEEGNYEFEVHKFERGYYQPSATSSLPACNMAMLTLKVSTPDGDAYITDNLQLCSKMEWKLSAFFRSIGLKKHGEKLVMKWDKVPGCKGRAHIEKTESQKNPGNFFNDVSYYIDPEAKPAGAKFVEDNEEDPVWM